MAFVTVLPLQTYPTGSVSGTFPIPAGPSSVDIRALRNTWPNPGGDVIKLTADISFDGGQTFQFLIGVTTSGGTVLVKAVAATHSSVHIDLPQPANTLRQLRATLQTFIDLSTQVDIQVL